MQKKAFSLLVLLALAQCSIKVVQISCSLEIDKTTVVSLVIDGDTFDTTSGDRVRLADINAPEKGGSGYHDAKNFLNELVYNKSVNLDIDDVYRTDRYDRLVCVVYVDYNSTHFVNVNKALLVEGCAVIWNFNNEFDPLAWSLYCPKEESQESPISDIQLEWVIIAIIAVIVIAGTSGLTLRRKKTPTKPSSRLIR